MKAFKGFGSDMMCRHKKYEVGRTYEEFEAIVCNKGMHACRYPLDCFRYYPPHDSIYSEVEVDGKISEDVTASKFACTKLTIRKILGITELIDKAIDYIKNNHGLINITSDPFVISQSNQSKSLNESAGSNCVNSSVGRGSVNKCNETGSINASTGVFSANKCEFTYSANVATGANSVNNSVSACSFNVSTGYGSVNVAEGKNSVNVSLGLQSTNHSGDMGTLSVGWGIANTCSGAIGSYILLCERKLDCPQQLFGEPVLIKIDGEKYLPNVRYKLENGIVVEA